jgi:hypothetical protein
MFWGCFSWDKKGPCHIWTTETASERTAADKELEKLNSSLKNALHTEWELSTRVRRMNLQRRPPGKKPQWRFTKANGKLVREGKAGGNDWYRYRHSFSFFSLILTNIAIGSLFSSQSSFPSHKNAKKIVLILLFKKTTPCLMLIVIRPLFISSMISCVFYGLVTLLT